MNDLSLFRDLMLSLSDAFSEEPRVGGRMAAKALRDADTGTYRRTISEGDPSSVLFATRVLSDALPLVEQVIACRHLLNWTCWAGEGLSDEISSRLYTTELVGPDGHLPAENVRVGLLASEPWTD